MTSSSRAVTAGLQRGVERDQTALMRKRTTSSFLMTIEGVWFGGRVVVVVEQGEAEEEAAAQ